MIEKLASKHQQSISGFFLFIFYVSFLFPLTGSARGRNVHHAVSPSNLDRKKLNHSKDAYLPALPTTHPFVGSKPLMVHPAQIHSFDSAVSVQHQMIGGPNQPEMASFKSIGADNMVNLFTGDFNYNIPLLDVGGYPVNIFYDGSVSPEQDASWVGLGWNINPGNINRNMRGVPDDFNGQDTMVQYQNMKPNKTWGVTVGGDFEVVGVKGAGVSVGGSLGMAFNNYLGPSLELGVRGSVSYNIMKKVLHEKNASDSSMLNIGPKLGLSLAVNSRNGTTVTPSLSLSANFARKNTSASIGLSASTSYNSRTGIKQLQLSEQMSYSSSESKKVTASKANSKGEYETKTYTKQNRSFSNTQTSSISFARPSYTPTLRLPVTNEATSGQFQLGLGMWGLAASINAEGYAQKSYVSPQRILQMKPLVGYLYYENAVNNPNAVMDFTRFNDKEVTPRTPIISVPQYTYDVFSIQGEGTGGSIRAYRNEIGLVKDNYTYSEDKSLSVGADAGFFGHFGVNAANVETPTYSCEWKNGNNINSVIGFKPKANGLSENVYFRNPGETSVLNNGQYNKIGGADLVRFQLGKNGYNPTVEPILDRFSSEASKIGSINLTSIPDKTERKKRTQVINILTAQEATYVGLEKTIRSYDSKIILDSANRLAFESINRVSGYRKPHHISQIDVTESNGKRYVYGVPVYNIVQKDFTFSVAATDLQHANDDLAAIGTDEMNAYNNSSINGRLGSKDGYVQITETPAFAHSFLLSGLLSPDYVDVTGDGITDDDLGDAVKFNYTRVKSGNNWAVHKWRTPNVAGKMANFNVGNRSEKKDDKGIVAYGERESWYTHSIESKTMIAFFKLSNRGDSKSALGEYGEINTNDSSQKKLDRIDLYSKADIKANGIAGAKPIKSVHFKYSYSLCNGIPNSTTGGKLTLDSIYFTFNGQNRSKKNKYVFSYLQGSIGNPVYERNAADRWGTYKPAAQNPNGIKNSLFPYPIQDKANADQNAGAWSLKKILLPSGGQIEVDYESDDYGFVQNKRAANMMQIAGIGFSSNRQKSSDSLYLSGGRQKDYLFVKVPYACKSHWETFYRYLDSNRQLAVKLAVIMPKGVEYLNVYPTFGGSISDSNRLYGVTDNPNIIWIKMEQVDGYSPLTITALEYLREQLPGQAFAGYDVSEGDGLEQIGNTLLGFLSSLKNTFTNPLKALISERKACRAILNESFVRLNNPYGCKIGGGQRVKKVLLKDNWKAMTGQYTSVYGQQYDYSTTEVFNGTTRKISSGVASYEPTIGGEENPFQGIVNINNQLPLGPASYSAVELPVLDAFFPAPLVGYSVVTVQSIRKQVANFKSRSRVGKQVTEFYTAKDFPVFTNYTIFDPSSDVSAHNNSSSNFFYKYSFDSRALSQGFLIATNDMHGKMKSQSSYADNDSATRISYTENYYKNTGKNPSGDLLFFVNAANNGQVLRGYMGMDIELMTDTRELVAKSSSNDKQLQVDWFNIPFPPGCWWLPFYWEPVVNNENNYREVTTTKTIAFHAILDSTITIEKGSVVSTKNMVYDHETGQLLVSRTSNLFDKPVYQNSYPAYWAFPGMGGAYKNIGLTYSNVLFRNGLIESSFVNQNLFESGDEIYIDKLVGDNLMPNTFACIKLNGSATIEVNREHKIWAVEIMKDRINGQSRFIFIDKDGNPFTGQVANMKIIRSGKRNLLSETAQEVTTLSMSTFNFLSEYSVPYVALNASAKDYREHWKNEAAYQQETSGATVCNAVNNPEILLTNPYQQGWLGNWRVNKNYVFYAERLEQDPSAPTNIAKDGTLPADFQPYWIMGNRGMLEYSKDERWIWNAQTSLFNKKGLEVENYDALRRFNSAQYGYGGNLPTAIANNARYREMGYEGFEDYHYAATLHPCPCFPTIDSANRHLKLGINQANISTTESHTGLSSLQILPNQSVQWKAPIKSAPSTMEEEEENTYPDLRIHLDRKPYDDVVVTPAGNGLKGYYYGANNWDNPNLTNYTYTKDNDDVYAFSNDDGHPIETIIWDGYIQVAHSGAYEITSPNADDSCIITIYNSSTGYSKTIMFWWPNQSSPGSHWFNLNKGNYNINIRYRNTSGKENLSLFWLYHIVEGLDTYVYFGQIPKANLYSYPPPASTIVTTRFYCEKPDTIRTLKRGKIDDFTLVSGQKMVLSAWVKETQQATAYQNNSIALLIDQGGEVNTLYPNLKPSGPVIDGWQRYEAVFQLPTGADSLIVQMKNNSTSGNTVYFDDLRIHPFHANMKSYVYDPINLKLLAELDANNYATFYEYDEEGTLVRTKAETQEGIKTLKETRSAQQSAIRNLVP